MSKYQKSTTLKDVQEVAGDDVPVNVWFLDQENSFVFVKV